MIGLALALAAAAAQAATGPAPAPVSTLPRVMLETSLGPIVVELETVKAPITANNFLHYVDQHRLDGITFYRVSKVANHFGFVQFGVDGDPKRALPPIKHEPTSETGLKHLDGTLSVARYGPGTAQGDFTISVGNQPSLDADPTRPDDATHTNLGYATFGRVISGTDVLMQIFDAPVSPTATDHGAFKGEIPVGPVKVLSARRVAP